MIAKKGYKVLVIEEHKEIGKPVECTGLVSWRIKNFVTDLPRSIIVNKINVAKIFSHDKSCLTITSEKPMFVINREEFDKFLARKATENGASIMLSTKFLKFKRCNKHVKVETNKGEFEAKILVGADGSNSRVARLAKLEQPTNTLYALQTKVKGEFDKNSVELWFGKNLTPDFFGWVVPENESIARAGIASKERVKNKFYKFLKSRFGKVRKPEVSGTIRYGLIKSSVSNNLLLVGDAACQVKPFSGGGIVYGLIGSLYAGIACVKALRSDDFSEDFLKKAYEEEWKKELRWPIMKGLFLSGLVHGMPDWFLDIMISFGDVIKPIFSFIDVDFL
ncbi:MAG TPA: NAD(P)/FAD-dependent oxidoreductase [Candidatus Aenigmarchaeota archaeon]|nr:NAD(P)/FAD-dependent oxidoreductase [Candidatus Aenigmarchaeota archaeon]